MEALNGSDAEYLDHEAVLPDVVYYESKLGQKVRITYHRHRWNYSVPDGIKICT